MGMCIAWVGLQAADYYTVSEIMEIYNGLELSSDQVSSDSYTVRGYVTRWKSGYPEYSNADFWIDDSEDGSTSMFMCFRLKGKASTDQRKLEVGEYIEATGYLKNYNGQAEIMNGTFRVVPTSFTLTITAGTGGWVNSEVNGTYDEGSQVTIKAIPDEDYVFAQWSDGNTEATRVITITEDVSLQATFKHNYNTVKDIMAIYSSLSLASGAKSTDSYTGRGYVTYWKSGYPDYQNADFFVDDYADGSTSMLQCFRLTGVDATDKRKLQVGDFVEFTGKLQNYQGRAEVCDGTFKVLASPQEEEDEDENCYPDYEGMTGAQIIAALHEAIKDPDTVTYYNLRADKTGVDYRADGNVWDMYTSCEFGPKGYCSGIGQTEECECYNREHMLPQSWWGNDNTKRMRTDLHHVIPTDAVTNSHRSNNPYGEVTGTADWSNAAGSKSGFGTYNTTIFEPIDEYKGDIARVYFYMLTCYRDENFTVNAKGRKVFTYIDGKAGLTNEALALFLKWHRNDPVSDKEINRNNGIEQLQHNRNPFVDMPELVEYIWGKKSSKTYTCKKQGLDERRMANGESVKILENGALFIVLPDGTKYNTMGIRMQ